MGGIVFWVLHAVLFWYAKYQCGGNGSIEAISRKFANFQSCWHTVVAILGFPLGQIHLERVAYIGMMILNSVLWGALLSMIVVPAFVKK